MSWEVVVWDSECTFRDSELSSPQPLQTQPAAGQGQDRGRTPAGMLTLWGPVGSLGDEKLGGCTSLLRDPQAHWVLLAPESKSTSSSLLPRLKHLASPLRSHVRTCPGTLPLSSQFGKCHPSFSALTPACEGDAGSLHFAPEETD